MDGVAVTQGANLTRPFAEPACSVSYDTLPEPVRELARQCVLDYFGVALAGAYDPLAHILLAELEEAGGPAHATVIRHQPPPPALPAAACARPVRPSPLY